MIFFATSRGSRRVTSEFAPQKAAGAGLRISTLALLLLLSACASKPTPPSWQAEAHGDMARFTQAYLKGETRVANAEFTRARETLSGTARAEEVSQAELIRCALQLASVDMRACAGFAPLAEDASHAQRMYAHYLAGQWTQLDVAALPAVHRGVVTAQGEAGLRAIADPVSRLVAAGALFQRGALSPAGIELAVETASEQGWRRPLLAWLGVQLMRAEQAGATDARARIARRIALVSGNNQ